MSLQPELRELILKNIDNEIGVFTEISPKQGGFDKFIERFGYEGKDIIGFLHGYLIGQISQTAHLTARLKLNRPLEPKERKELTELLKPKIIDVKEIISRLRNA